MSGGLGFRASGVTKNWRRKSIMPRISVIAPKESDVNKKRKLVEKLTDSVVEVYGVPREAVSVEIWGVEPEDVGVGGMLLADRMRQGPPR